DTSGEATWVSRTRSRRSSAGPLRDARTKLKRLRETPRTPRKRLSRTLKSRKSSEDWYVRRMPMRMRSWGGKAVTSSPKNRTRPRVAAKSPVTTLNSVVLPAPLAPMTARRSPAATENETSSIARRAPNGGGPPPTTRAPREPGGDATRPRDRSGARRGPAGGCRTWGGGGGHFWAPHYGQLGSSREPILNSAGG